MVGGRRAGREHVHKLEVMVEVKRSGSQHYARTRAGAVEDYCNARNIEWDGDA